MTSPFEDEPVEALEEYGYAVVHEEDLSFVIADFCRRQKASGTKIEPLTVLPCWGVLGRGGWLVKLESVT